ncbi:hypothetical protein [Microbacterium allomyrinae]|uniref:Uncharacterized protein n=1 Tax=Microbacterium allomyrinae TaxID=2830666 RepID=A0A9X1LY77_9MICO|nr:hypothetical protein [Microbacterium allomyrinae]MCC2033891.1 hypothetical protein [Microbacterium allomyrinae]
MSRPTLAQVSCVELLLDLITLTEDTIPLMITAADVADAREVITATQTLVVLVDGHESWIDQALAFDLEATATVKAALERAVLR